MYCARASCLWSLTGATDAGTKACLEGNAGPTPRVVTLLCQVCHHEQLVLVACTGTMHVWARARWLFTGRRDARSRLALVGSRSFNQAAHRVTQPWQQSWVADAREPCRVLTKALPQAELDRVEQLFPRHAQRALHVHAARVAVQPHRRGRGRQVRYLQAAVM